ncbi:MAG: hypothetical protein GY757_23910 [bacterium]|nr:hypothetical protein [bacterium]
MKHKKKLKLGKQTIHNFVTELEDGGKNIKGGHSTNCTVGRCTGNMITCMILPGGACIPETSPVWGGHCL